MDKSAKEILFMSKEEKDAYQGKIPDALCNLFAIPTKPCIVCGNLTSNVQFVGGIVCSAEHMEKVNEEHKKATAD